MLTGPHFWGQNYKHLCPWLSQQLSYKTGQDSPKAFASDLHLQSMCIHLAFRLISGNGYYVNEWRFIFFQVLDTDSAVGKRT